jgi:NTP pyrophosphatase (non-canonical NTP hydrolase)
MKFSNGLSDAETERLAILAEECAEVIQVVGKILRHGYESSHPRRPEQGTNREHLEEELGNVGVIMTMMVDAKDVDADSLQENYEEKRGSIGKYLHHQEGL